MIDKGKNLEPDSFGSKELAQARTLPSTGIISRAKENKNTFTKVHIYNTHSCCTPFTEYFRSEYLLFYLPCLIHWGSGNNNLASCQIYGKSKVCGDNKAFKSSEDNFKKSQKFWNLGKHHSYNDVLLSFRNTLNALIFGRTFHRGTLWCLSKLVSSSAFVALVGGGISPFSRHLLYTKSVFVFVEYTVKN